VRQIRSPDTGRPGAGKAARPGAANLPEGRSYKVYDRSAEKGNAMTGLISLIVVGAIALLLAFFVIGIFNNLVALKNRYTNAFAQIEVQLKRRYDLIPNLVETAKGYMAHERQTLEAVIAARNQALAGLKAAAAAPGSADAMKQLAGAEGMLAGALGRLSVVVEQYPDLKANQNMMQLSEELTSTENKVAFSRQAFNDAVTAYNTYKQTFPPVIVAAMFGHGRDASLLEFADSAAIQEAPKVSFT
jgi:LemA protein